MLVERAGITEDLDSIKNSLALLVARTLSFDQAVIPSSTYHLIPTLLSTKSLPRQNPLSDPDDFIIISQDEAQHIAIAIDEAFSVELTSEVVVAAANVAKLAYTIYQSRRLLKQSEFNQVEGWDKEESETREQKIVGEVKPERLK